MIGIHRYLRDDVGRYRIAQEYSSCNKNPYPSCVYPYSNPLLYSIVNSEKSRGLWRIMQNTQAIWSDNIGMGNTAAADGPLI